MALLDRGEDWVDFSGDVAFEQAHCFSFRFASGEGLLDLAADRWVGFHAHHHDAVRGGVALPVAAAVESIPFRFP